MHAFVWMNGQGHKNAYYIESLGDLKILFLPLQSSLMTHILNRQKNAFHIQELPGVPKKKLALFNFI